jgi:hypothetical protein
VHYRLDARLIARPAALYVIMSVHKSTQVQLFNCHCSRHTVQSRVNKELGSDAEEDEDIGEMFAAYGGPRKAISQTNLERMSPFSVSDYRLLTCFANRPL